MDLKEYAERIANAKDPIEVAKIKKEAKQSIPQTKSTLNKEPKERKFNLVKVV